MITAEQLHSWSGLQVVDSDGKKVGKVRSTYEDQRTGTPDWLTVASGLLRKSVRFVPVFNASSDSGVVHLGFTEEAIRSAPEIDDDGSLSFEDERALRSHYGVLQEDFGYGTQRKLTLAEEGAEADQRRTDARKDAKNLRRPEDHAVNPDGSPLRPTN